MSRKRLTNKQKETIKQLYKAHFSPRETASIMSEHCCYNTVTILYRIFRRMEIPQYDRLSLIKNSGEELNGINCDV